MAATERPVLLTGVGGTALTREPAASEVDLAFEACQLAIEDAGLEPLQVDGINIQVHHYPPPPTSAVADKLGLAEGRWSVDGGLGVGALARVAQAIDAKDADAVVVCKIMNTVAPVTTPAIDPATGGVPGDNQFEVPYGLAYTMQRVGFMKRRWMHRYGITDDQVGWLCSVQRDHALQNPGAFWRTPLTVEEYLASRWIADPIHVLDCDYPVNGAFAYVVVNEDLAKRSPEAPVRLVGWSGSGGVSPLPHLDPELGQSVHPAIEQLYGESGLGPDDLDVWMLYDGFSFLAMQWMEALGVVGPGESGAYVDGGDRIRSGGEHPTNTHGGQLSEGRMHGTGHILEAVRQVRGTAGGRQAARAEHAVVTTGYPAGGSAAILGRW